MVSVLRFVMIGYKISAPVWAEAPPASMSPLWQSRSKKTACGAFGLRLPAPPPAIPGVLFGAPIPARPGSGLMDTRAPHPACPWTDRLRALAPAIRLGPRGRTGPDGNRRCCYGCRCRSCCGWPSGCSSVCCSRNPRATREGRLKARSPAENGTGKQASTQTQGIGVAGVPNPALYRGIEVSERQPSGRVGAGEAAQPRSRAAAGEAAQPRSRGRSRATAG